MSITSQAAAAPTRISSCTTISNSGSYILSRNIDGTAALTDCVVIDAPYVTLNLSGFAIGGPGVISGASPADGIFVSAGNTNVTIRNGSVTGWINGIVFDIDTDGAVVEGIRSHENINSGMQVLGSGALIRHNITHDNLVAGILFADSSTVIYNVANNNGMFGITGFCDSTVMFNTAIGNGTTNLVPVAAAGCIVDFNSAP